MQAAIIIACVAAFAAAVLMIDRVRQNRRLLRRLRQEYGTPPVKKYDEYVMESISSFWKLKSAERDAPCCVDDITWRDLDMDGVYRRLNAACSSAGEEILYATLRNQRPDRRRLETLERTADFFDSHPAERLKAQAALARLGRVTGNGIAGFFLHPGDKKLPFAPLYPVLSACALLSLFSLLWLHTGGIPYLLTIAVVNIAVYYRTKAPLGTELTSLRCIAALIRCAGRLSHISGDGLGDQPETLARLCRPLRKVGKFAASVMGNPVSETDFLTEYFRIFFMLDFLAYNRMLAAISRRREECLELYRTVGALDTALAVASFRRSLPFYCRPEFTDSDEIEMRNVVHPMLKKAVPNSVTLEKSVLVTGSNASGKSTFIKAVAVNAILAQTIHTCTAGAFRLKPSFVVTSMAVSDDLGSGESYYMAEIRSLRRILDGLNEHLRCLCFIDEILKGTNTVERIAASAAVLRYLQDQNCLCMVATHDIELTEIADGGYGNFHFEERIESGGVLFDYTLHPGRATTKNAIRLLEALEYPRDITRLARDLAVGFETNRVWRRCEKPETPGDPRR